jgi:hypothetical protein
VAINKKSTNKQYIIIDNKHGHAQTYGEQFESKRNVLLENMTFMIIMVLI